MKKVLFVCLGNICRSPAAEGVFKLLISKEGLESKIIVDSAGTSSCHAGELADSRMRKTAAKRSIDLTSRSRQFIREDFEEFDYIVVMDESNYQNVLSLDSNEKYKEKVFMMTDFGENLSLKYVPDPYYGGDRGFEDVLDIVNNCSLGLLKKIKLEMGLN